MDSKEAIYRKYLSALANDIVARYKAAGGTFGSGIEIVTTELSAQLVTSSAAVFAEKGKTEETAEVDPNEVKNGGLTAAFAEKKAQEAAASAQKIATEAENSGDAILSAAIQDFLEKNFWKMVDEIGTDYAEKITNDIVEIIKKSSK